MTRSWLLVALLLPLWPSITAAQASGAECPDGNLLEGRRPHRWDDVAHPPRLTDGVAAVEGDPWDSSVTSRLTTASASFVFDLGRELPIRAVLLQADNNDTYPLSASTDGRTWKRVWVAPKVAGAGMRTRVAADLDVRARYLRIDGMEGDGAYSVGELQVFCQQPDPWPPALKREKGKVVDRQRERLITMSYRKITYGLAGLVVFAFLLGRSVRRGWWSTWAPPAGAAAIWLYGAGTAHGWQGLLGAAIAVVGVGLWLWHLAVNEGVDWVPRADAAGLVAVGIAAAYVANRAGVPKAAEHSMAVAAVAHLALLGAVRAGDRPWTVWVPPFAATAIAVFTAYHTYGATAAVATGVGAALAVGLAARLPSAREARGRWIERVALVLLIATGAHTWTNYGTFHGGRAVHFHDTFHYFMGSKYFRENGYRLLYHCAAVAQADEGLAEKISKRKIRNLTTNLLEPATVALDDAEACRQAFTPERWVAFQQDVRLFRSFFGAQYWERLFHDHGYNATPVWNMVGHAISNHDWKSWIEGIPVGGPGENTAERRAWFRRATQEFRAAQRRFDERIQRIALIDAALYAGIFLLIGWAFGLRAMALAVVIWGAGYPWAFFWTGGAFGRVPWLFMATAGVCLLKKHKPLLGGFALAWSLLLRVFPGALFAGVGLKILHGLYRERTISRPHLRVALGGILAVALLVPASLPASGGFEAYPEFIANSMKHKQTPLTNHMGLPTLFAWHPKLTARAMKNDQLDDPYQPWKQGRRDTLAARAPLYWGAVLALLVLLGVAGRDMEDWEVTAASTVMIVALFELTCYYYNFMVLLAPLALRRFRYMVALAGMAVASQYIQLRIGWFDQQYTAESLLAFGVMLFLLVDRVVEARRARQRAAAPAPPVAEAA